MVVSVLKVKQQLSANARKDSMALIVKVDIKNPFLFSVRINQISKPFITMHLHDNFSLFQTTFVSLILASIKGNVQ